MQQFGVVLTGRLCEGVRPEEARANLARLLRIDDAARLDRLLSGKPVLLKKGLEAAQARRYEAALRQAGVQCELRPEAPAPAATLTATTTPAAARAPEPSLADAARAAPAPSRPTLSLEPLAPEAGAAAPAAAVAPGLSLEPLALAPMTEAAAPAPSTAGAPGLWLEPLALAPVVEATAPAPAGAPAAAPAPSRPVAAYAAPASGSPEGGDSGMVRHVVVKGSGSGYGDSSITPDEVKGLCWGGFFLPWIWGGFNGVSISFLALPGMGILRRVLPRSILIGLSLLLSFFMLFKGRELAWQNKTWESVEHFNRVQRRWTGAGLGFVMIMAMVIPSCVASEKKHEQAMAAELARMKAESAAEEEDPSLRAREAYLESATDPAAAAEEGAGADAPPPADAR